MAKLHVTRIEALADCIGYLNDAHNPESHAYQIRNPGLCRAYSFKQLNQLCECGQSHRTFTSSIGGYRFLVQDLQWKCSGQTRAKGETGKLKPTSSLTDILKSFRMTSIETIMQAVSFLNLSLQTDEITASTELKFFLEEVK
jgi:hypothetical protein